MSPTLNTLGGALLMLTWQGDPGTTTTVQTSLDLQVWETLPFVVTETGGQETLSLEKTGARLFARLRRSDDGDTNANGLPDLWEWETFGFLDVDPDADPDQDGVSTLNEWKAGTDPLDFYNGITPAIFRPSASEWLVPAAGISRQSLFLHISRPDRTPWANAPVTISLDSGRPALLRGDESPPQAVEEIVAYTDSLGRLNSFQHNIRILGADSPGVRESLLITAGNAQSELSVHTIPGLAPRPPRNLASTRSADGTLQSVSWSGDPGGATALIIEERDETGNWNTVTELSIAELPPPHPETGRFDLNLN